MARHRDIILVPCYFRPEFLYLTLEHICAARGSENKDLWLYHDRKFEDEEQFENELKEIEVVISYFKRALGARLKPFMRPQNGYYGNSYNVLEAYAKAHATNAEFVYLIEDDVFITPDFFEWHNIAHRFNPECFCTVAGECDRNQHNCLEEFGAVNTDTGYSATWFASREYASLGVCWKRENLKAVVEHANKDYYHNPSPYILKHFPSSTMGLKMMEQDGLIQRIAEQRLQKILFAVPQKSFHVGVFGYHRSIGPDNMFVGTLPERIEFYRSAASDKSWLEKVAGFQSDVQVFPRA